MNAPSPASPSQDTAHGVAPSAASAVAALAPPSVDAERWLAYARAAAAVQRLPLDDPQLVRVAATLARTGALAALLDAAPLAPEDEPAELYRPAPFPPPEAGEARRGTDAPHVRGDDEARDAG